MLELPILSVRDGIALHHEVRARTTMNSSMPNTNIVAPGGVAPPSSLGLQVRARSQNTMAKAAARTIALMARHLMVVISLSLPHAASAPISLAAS